MHPIWRGLPDVISFDVPSAPWTMPARREAVFEPTGAVTESQMRTLSFGAQIASLLVQIECASGGGARLRRDDGAAPLIGSSAAIHALRERIERVAVTDSRSSSREDQVHNRTRISLGFFVKLPSTTAVGRWRERKRGESVRH